MRTNELPTPSKWERLARLLQRGAAPLAFLLVIVEVIITNLVVPRNAYLSLILAVSILSVGLLWDIRSELRQQSSLEDRRARLMRALELSPISEEVLIKMLEAAGAVPFDNPFLTAEAASAVEECSDRLDAIRRDRLERPGYDVGLLCRLAAETEESFIATSTSIDDEFWDSHEGVQYLGAQENLARKAAYGGGNVDVRRIFILSKSHLRNGHQISRLRRILDDQVARGFQLRWIPSDELGPDENQDYVVMDGSLLVTATTNHELEIISMTVNFDHDEARVFAHRFERTWQKARVASELPQQVI